MIRCRHCGAENYAIDMWCSTCSQHLDWAPPAAAAPAPEASMPDPIVSEPETAPIAEPEAAPVAALVAEPEVAPIVEPEAAPVVEPEAAPIVEPEAAPIVEPEAAPIVEPEAAPVAEPEPAVAPVFAAEPVVAPMAAREPEPAAVAAFAPVSRSTSSRRTRVWLLPAAAAAVLAVLLALPVAGWFKAAGQQAVSPQLPLTAGLSATASATPTPTETPTPSAAPTPAPTSAQPATQPPAIQPPADLQPMPVPASQTAAGDPSGAIGSFYQAVAAHRFDAAAATWSGQMQANYPPAEYINRRFAYTQQMNLRAARTIANNGQVATVYIDLFEVYAGSQRHWAGTWQMVRSSSGWLLNQPNLRAAG